MKRPQDPIQNLRLVVDRLVRRQVVADVTKDLTRALARALRDVRRRGVSPDLFKVASAALLLTINACGSVTTSATDTDAGTDLGSQPATGSAGTGAGSAGSSGAAGTGAAGTTSGAGQGAAGTGVGVAGSSGSAGSSGAAGTGAAMYVTSCGLTDDEKTKLHGKPCGPDRCETRVDRSTTIAWDWLYADLRCEYGVCTPRQPSQCGGHNDRPCISDPAPHCFVP
jgi:hypothetical protein